MHYNIARSHTQENIVQYMFRTCPVWAGQVENRKKLRTMQIEITDLDSVYFNYEKNRTR